MRHWNLSLGKWLGIQVWLHWTWWLWFLIVVFSNPTIAPLFLSMFFIVLLHEFGHALAGKYLGAMVQDITLYPIGGVALMAIPTKPRLEFLIAIAGPLVNVVLMPLFVWLNYLVGGKFLEGLFYINAMILVFNLIPALPLDGGRIFRAILGMVMDYRKATLVAGRVSQILCVVGGITAIYWGSVYLMIIVVLIFLAAEAEIRSKKVSTPNSEAAQILASLQADADDLARRLEAIRRKY